MFGFFSVAYPLCSLFSSSLHMKGHIFNGAMNFHTVLCGKGETPCELVRALNNVDTETRVFYMHYDDL